MHIDDSHNTGNDFHNENQPYFVLAAVTCEEKDLQQFEKIVEDYKREQQIMGELKSNATNFNQLESIIDRLKFFDDLSQIVRLDFVCYEKRMILAQKLTEWLFDWDNNEFTNALLTWPDSQAFRFYNPHINLPVGLEILNVRKSLAEAIARSGAVTLIAKRFQKRNKRTKERLISQADLEEMLRQIKASFEAHGLEVIGNYMIPQYFKLDWILFEINQEQDNLLYQPSLFELLCAAVTDDQFQEIVVYHDGVSSSKTQDNLYYEEALKRLSGGKLQEIVFEASDQNLGIQVADYLAGHLSRMVTTVLNGKTNYLDSSDSREFLLECLEKLPYRFKFSYTNWQALHETVGKTNEMIDIIAVLQNQFHYCLKQKGY